MNNRLWGMIPWEKRLAHDRQARDAFVACGNPAPNKPDPPGGLILVTVRKFDGKIFFAKMAETGHTSSDIQTCACLLGK